MNHKLPEEKSTKDRIAAVLHDLVCKRPYTQITIEDIVRTVPVSRRTFYNYFSDKDSVIQYLVTRQFMENAYPVCKMRFGKKGLRAFFSYIWDDQAFYLSIAQYDGGDLLRRSLIYTYNKTVEYVAEYAHPISNSEKRINPDIYKIYTHSALAAVVVYWLRKNLQIPLDDIARDTALMMEHPHSFVRDHYLI